MVEHHLAKVRVAGSNPVVRSNPMLRRARRLAMFAVAVAASLGSSSCSSESRGDAVVAAAADTRDAFNELAATLAGDGVVVEFVFGSSGLLREQVLNGAPYDVYVSANTAFVDEVIAAGEGVAETREAFAVGRLAVISAPGTLLPTEFGAVADYSRIVIANPAHAPYGVAAREAFAEAGISSRVSNRLVLAENVADAVRIVQAGEADVGVVALSLVGDAPHLLVPAELHQPIRQSLVITEHGRGNDAARRFVELLSSPFGREVLERHGFTVESP